MQLKVWLVRKHLSRLGMQLKHPVYKKLCTIVLSAVAALAVSLSRRQNGKSCEGSEEEKARSLARKRRRQSVHCKNILVTSTIFWSSQLHAWCCVTHYKLQRVASCLHKCSWEAPLSLGSSYRKPIAIWLHFCHFYHNHATKALLQGQMCRIKETPTSCTRNAISLLKGDTNLTKGEASQLHSDSEWDW